MQSLPVAVIYTMENDALHMTVPKNTSLSQKFLLQLTKNPIRLQNICTHKEHGMKQQKQQVA